MNVMNFVSRIFATSIVLFLFITTNFSIVNAADADIRKPYVRCGKALAAPVIDGRLEDKSWNNALEITPFVVANGFAKEQTKAYLLYDADYIYIGIRCNESLLNPLIQREHEVKSNITKRDGCKIWTDDSVEIFLQPDPKKAPYYHFVINVGGVLYDAIYHDKSSADKSWNSNARVRVHKTDKFWQIEMSIPLTDFNKTISRGDKWLFNVTRNQNPGFEHSSWAPVAMGFHDPKSFGMIEFGQDVPGTRDVVFPLFSDENRNVTGRILNNTAKDNDFLLSVITEYGKEERVSHSMQISVPANNEAKVSLEYFFNQENKAFLLDFSGADKRPRTLRADTLKVVPSLNFLLTARVKADNLQATRAPFFCMNVYNAAGTVLLKYKKILPIPVGNYNWKQVRAKVKLPPTAEKMILFLRTGKRVGANGKLWLDDIKFCAKGSDYNILSNGGVELNEIGIVSGWPSQGRILVVPSYKRQADSGSISFSLTGSKGQLYYSSPSVNRELTAFEKNAVRSSLVHKLSYGNKYKIKKLYVAQGSYLYVPVVLQSSEKKKPLDCKLFLEVPEFLSLIDPSPRAVLIKEESIQKNGKPYRRYVLKYTGKNITAPKARARKTILNRLFLKCAAIPSDKSGWVVSYYALAKDDKETAHNVPLTLLPPLAGKRPKKVQIKNWAAATMFWRQLMKEMNARETEAVFDTWRKIGINQTVIYASILQKRHSLADNDFSIRRNIPIRNRAKNAVMFPGGKKYLASHPEARAVLFTGKQTRNAFCPLYFMSKENEHLSQVRDYINKLARKASFMEWDYEMPHMAKHAVCLDKRCIDAFRKYAKIGAGVSLSPQIIRNQYKKQWIDFRCYLMAEMAGLFRGYIKEANPDCVFGVYSGYQGKTGHSHGGVDWRYMSKYIDVATCGYGRNKSLLKYTHQALGNRPLIASELIGWGIGPYDYEKAKITFFRRLTDGGSGIGFYYNWCINDMVYSAIASVSAVISDFERFFATDIDAKGFHIARYNRNDNLVKISGQGTKADIVVLTYDKERLIFLFNEKGKERTFKLKNLNWQPDLVCTDYDTKKVYGSELSMTVPAMDVKILHIGTSGKN